MAELESFCGRARRANVGNCILCVRSHTQFHDCGDTVIDSFCASTSADVSVFLTTADQAHLFESLPSIPLSAASATPSIRVEKQTRYQSIVGFGAAITDAAAWVLSTAKPFDTATFVSICDTCWLGKAWAD